MAKLRVLSGPDVLRILADFGILKISQRGSHIKVRRVLSDGRNQNSAVPNHEEVDRGTLQAIYRRSGRFIPDVELRPRIFAD